MSDLSRASLAHVPAPCRRFRPFAEGLEDRRLLANLQITNLLVVDAGNAAMPSPVVGSKYFLRAEWSTIGLGTGDRYVVRFSVDGIALDSATISGAPGTNLAYSWYLGGWYAAAGAHTATATVDGGGAIAETSEADNTRTLAFGTRAPDLPAKLLWPLGDPRDPETTIGNYNDVDPRPDRAGDFAGGTNTYDGHDAFDIGLANFARMDAGKTVYAAAAGTVIAAEDGHFDRRTDMGDAPVNYVSIDHGNGWVTSYLHLKSASVAVKPGEVVAAGQPLGLVGSSGSSTAPHLHFAVYYRGLAVETMYGPSVYFVDPPPYKPTVAPHVTAAGISNGPIGTDFRELPQSVAKFPADKNWDPWFWYQIPNIPRDANVAVRWYRPDGSVAATFGGPQTGGAGGGDYNWVLGGTSGTLGTWQVALLIDDVELVRRSFTVTPAGGGEPELRVESGGTYIIDGRSTAIDLGTVAAGSAAPATTFTIKNTGAAALTLGGLALPPDVKLVGGFPATVASGGAASFALALDTTRAGSKFGAVQFHSNDADEGVFQFHVGGTVAGSLPSGSPQLALPGAALVYLPGSAPQALDPSATLADTAPGAMAAGGLVVEFASNARAEDRLGIRDDGGAPGRIGVAGGTVTFGGLPIAKFQGGTGATPLQVAFNSSATVAAAQALLRNLTYGDVAAAPDTVPRYIRVSVTDGVGLVADDAIRCVIFDGRAVTSIVVAPASPAAHVGEVVAFTATGTMSDRTTRDLTKLVNWTSDASAVATITVSGVATALVPGAARIGATIGAITGTAILAVPNPVPSSIQVTPATPSVAKGQAVQFAATGLYDDGSTRDITTSVAWASADTGLATVSAAGRATGLAVGSTVVTATLNGVSGSATLTVTPAVLLSVVVAPATATLPVGLTRPFTATGTYSDATVRDLTASVAWASGTSAVASVGPDGVATALSVGTSSIVATLGEITGDATLTVTPAALASILVAPASSTVPVGLGRAFTATGRFTDGTDRDLTTFVAWTSLDPVVATIAAGGLARALRPGTATIHASIAGVDGTATITVDPAALMSIAVTPAARSMRVGATTPFAATGTYTDNSTSDLTALVIWSSSAPAVAMSDARGVVTGLAAGTATITANLGDVAATTGATVRVLQLTAIAIGPAESNLPLGLGAAFVATGTFDDRSTADLTSEVAWSSSAPGVATIDPGGLAASHGIGATTITAALGATRGSTSLNVTAPALVAITIDPPAAELPRGRSLAFRATGHFTDQSASDLTGSVAWASSNPAVATIGPDGLARGLAIGATVVAAEQAGIRGTATLGVGAPVLVSILIGLASPDLVAGQARQLAATGVHSDGSTLDLTGVVAWTGSSDGVVSVAPGGLATALAPGFATIEAVSGGIRGSAVLAVVAAPPPPPTTITGTQVDARAGHLRSLCATFGSPLAAIRGPLGVFRLTSAGADRIFGTKDDKALRLRSATLSADGLSIVVTPRSKVTMRQPLRLTMDTDSAGVVARSDGRAIDGDHDGRPGGLYNFSFGTKSKSTMP